MNIAWISLIIGILVCIWGAGVLLTKELMNWSKRSVRFLALVDVLIGAFMISFAIILLV